VCGVVWCATVRQDNDQHQQTSLTVMMRVAIKDVIDNNNTNEGGNHGTSSNNNVTPQEPSANQAIQPSGWNPVVRYQPINHHQPSTINHHPNHHWSGYLLFC
jgi:hypothetical protein